MAWVHEAKRNLRTWLYFISSQSGPGIEADRTPELCIYGTHSFLKNYKNAKPEHHAHDNPSPLGKC